jgi:hypothetical protein
VNFALTSNQVDQQMRDVRRQVAGCRGRSHHTRARPARTAIRAPRLRRRVGFTLIEAGLRLLAADRAARTRPSPDTV